MPPLLKSCCHNETKSNDKLRVRHKFRIRHKLDSFRQGRDNFTLDKVGYEKDRNIVARISDT